MGKGGDFRDLWVMRLYHFVSNVTHPVTFKLFPVGEQLSPHYRLATIQEVHDHRGALLRAMPLWEIANLDDGSVDGALYGGHTRMEIRDDVSEQLAMRLYQSDSDVAGPPVTFKLFHIGDQLLTQYRLATIKEVQDHREALLRAMPGCEIANLADGSVHGAALGGCTRMEWKKDVSHQLAMELYPLVRSQFGPPKFKLFHIGKELPPQYWLATVQDVHDHQDSLLRAMPGWEIANLTDGSVDGASYGGHIRTVRHNDVGHQLAMELQEPFVSNITPPMTRDHREAFLRTMPGWEIANLADSFVDGALYGGRTSKERFTDVGLQFAVKLDHMAGPPMTFKLLRIGDELPAQYCPATGKEIYDHREALLTTMPGLESTNLASRFGNSSCNIGLDWIIIIACNSMTTTSCDSSTSSCGGRYIDALLDDVVTSQIWPKLISSLLKSVRGQGDQYSAVHILWKLRMLNKYWMNLVDSSVEWAAFRLANSFIDAAKHSSEVKDTFIMSRDFLSERTKLRSPCKKDLLIAPYPDLPDDRHFQARGYYISDDNIRLLRCANTVGPLESDGLTSQESDNSVILTVVAFLKSLLLRAPL